MECRDKISVAGESLMRNNVRGVGAEGAGGSAVE